MSQELKTKFTADASDFNGAVKQIEGKLKGVGKLGQGFGVGNVTGGIGNFLGGLGSLGFVGGGAAGVGFGVAKVFQNISQTLEDREKAIKEGLPVAELTSFGKFLASAKGKLEESGRAFSGIGVLLTQGLQAYQDFVLGDTKAATERFVAAQKKAAEALEERARSDALAAENEKRVNAAAEQELQNRKDRAKTYWKTIADYQSDTQIAVLEKSGNPVAAEALRLARRFNEIQGTNLNTPEGVLNQFGDMIQQRLSVGEMTGQLPVEKLATYSDMVQQSPELTDRLRRIGAAGGDFPSQTTQVFREMRSLAQQQLDATKQVVENTKDGAVTLR